MIFDERKELFYHAIKAMPQEEIGKQLEKIRENSFFGGKYQLIYLLGVEELTKELTQKTLSQDEKSKWIHDFCREEKINNTRNVMNEIIGKVARMTDTEIGEELREKRIQAWQEAKAEAEKAKASKVEDDGR